MVRPLSIPAADPFGSCATGNGQAIRWMHFLKHQIKAGKDAILGVNFWRKHTFLWFFQNLLGQVSKWCCFNIMLERSEPFKPVYWASFESEALGEWFASQNWFPFAFWRGSFLELGCPSLSAQVFVDVFFLQRYPSGETEMWFKGQLRVLHKLLSWPWLCKGNRCLLWAHFEAYEASWPVPTRGKVQDFILQGTVRSPKKTAHLAPSSMALWGKGNNNLMSWVSIQAATYHLWHSIYCITVVSRFMTIFWLMSFHHISWLCRLCMTMCSRS